jgi:hypothetical protein
MLAKRFFYVCGGICFLALTWQFGVQAITSSRGRVTAADTLIVSRLIVRDGLGREAITLGSDIDGHGGLTNVGMRIVDHGGTTILLAVGRALDTDGLIIQNGAGDKAAEGPGKYVGLGIDESRPNFPVGLELRGTVGAAALVMDKNDDMGRIYASKATTPDEKFAPYVHRVGR